MNYFGLLYRLLLFLNAYRFGCGEEIEYKMKLEEVTIDGEMDGDQDKIWKDVNLTKSKYSYNFSLQNAEIDTICDGSFLPADVEIVELFRRVVRISVIKETKHLWINFLFAQQGSVPLFFGDIRWQQKRECSKMFLLGILAQYRIKDFHDDENNPIINEDRLELIGSPVSIYIKNLYSYNDVRPVTINFAPYKAKTPSDGIYLVIQSMYFNIVEGGVKNLYVLCAEDIPTHRFILYFTNGKARKNFTETSSYESIINPRIDCSLGWLTYDVIDEVRALNSAPE